MKIKFDKKNKVTIADGYYKGKKIRAVAVCHPEDTFDEEFGSDLVKRKYKIKQDFIKMNLHESYIKKLLTFVKWINNEVVYENKIVDALDIKIQKETDDCLKFTESKYNK